MGFNDTAYYTQQMGAKGLLFVDDTGAHLRTGGFSGFKITAASVLAAITLDVVATTDEEEGSVAADIISLVAASAVGDVISVRFTSITLTSGSIVCYKR